MLLLFHHKLKNKSHSIILTFLSFCIISGFLYSHSNAQIKVYFNKSVDTAWKRYGINAQGDVAIYRKLIERINQATYSIDIAMYSLSVDSVSYALINAKKRGVKVRFVYRNTNNGDIYQSSVAMLRDSGIQIIQRKQSSGIMHNKFFVFDARDSLQQNPIVFTGSLNFTSTGQNDDWNNVLDITNRPLALAYTKEFEEMWGTAGDIGDTATAKFGSSKSDNTPHIFTVGGKTIECYFSPSDGTNAKIANALSTATSNISFALLSFTRQEIVDSMKKRNKNFNVTVRGIMEQADVPAVFDSLITFAQMYKHTSAGLFHHKYAIIDEGKTTAKLVTGSHNWSLSANTTNDENTLIIYNDTIANLYLQEFEKRLKEVGSIISGNIFNDLDSNGMQNNGESGADSLQVKLIFGDTLTASTISNGNFQFLTAPFGTSTVRFGNNTNWTQTFPANNNGYSVSITSMGQNFTGKNFGAHKTIITPPTPIAPSFISGVVFHDKNANANFENAETGLNGWTLLISGDTSFSTTTNEDGYFSFDSLSPGNYRITYSLEEQWLKSFPTHTTQFEISIDSGGTIVEQINFGFFQTGTIAGTVFHDFNANAVRDNNESGMQNWKVYLQSSSLESTMTDANGNFLFTSVIPSTYIVTAEFNNNFVQSFPVFSNYSETIFSGQTMTNVTFGYYQKGTFAGTVFNDLNANAVRDNNENGIPNWKIFVQTSSLESTITDANGNYIFTNIIPASYSIFAEIKNGYVKTFPSANNYNGILSSGESIASLNFAYYRTSAILAKKIVDNDGNIATSNDRVGKIWQLFLYKNSVANENVISSVNDSTLFVSHLSPGIYIVAESESIYWKHLTNSISGTATNDTGTIVSFSISDGANAEITFINSRLDTTTFRTFSQHSLGGKAQSLRQRRNKPLPVPNENNIRDTVFSKRFKKKDGGLVVGVARKDSAKTYGWIRATDNQSFINFLPLTGNARPFDSLGKKLFVKEFQLTAQSGKSLLKKGFSNHLVGELLALRINIEASELGMTPKHFGALQFVDESNPVCYEKTVEEIADLTDTALTQWRGKNSSLYVYLDSAIAKINNAFTARIDSPYSGVFYFRGAKQLYEIGFLKKQQGKIPTFLSRVGENEYRAHELLTNYPNPFNPVTSLSFRINETNSTQRVTLRVYSLLGTEIASLINNEILEAGLYTIPFDASKYSSGIYFYSLSINSNTIITKKMLLLK